MGWARAILLGCNYKVLDVLDVVHQSTLQDIYTDMHRSCLPGASGLSIHCPGTPS